MARGKKILWVDEEFYKLIEPTVVRDARVRRALERRTNKKYYETYGDATKALAKEMRRFWD